MIMRFAVSLKRLFLSMLSLMAFNTGIAQQTNTIIPPSPDAAALGVYGSIPVSTYTGIPNISIPLYNLAFRDVQIPIALNYHGGGVTVEQDASWVGLGWSLNIGGVITRTVKGGDDMQFANDGFSNLGAGTMGGYTGYPYDNQNETQSNFLDRICRQDIDAEPDVFYFNFMGKSGSFVLESGQNSALNFVVGTPLKAEKIDIRYDKANRRWQIKTADGFTFYFGTIEATETLHGNGEYGAGPEEVEFSNTSFGFFSWDDIVVSSWYLDKMVTPLGEEVTYIYDTVDEMVNGTPSGKKFSQYQSARMSLMDVKRTSVVPGSEIQCFSPSLRNAALKIFTNHIYLKEVRHSLGKIVLNKSLREDMMLATTNSSATQYLWRTATYLTWSLYGPQKLDNIVVLDNAGITVKKIELEYNYFNAGATGESRYNFKRLKLEKVRECGGSTACNPYYQLFYNETYPLPSKYSNAQDFWGYYNGAYYNPSRIPFGTAYDHTGSGAKYYSLGDANRQPDGIYMTAGTLNKIVYPTGGSSEFEFEPNDYDELGVDAFALTDFVNNGPIGLASIVTAEYDPNAYQTVSFSITGLYNQEVTIDGTMTYYPSATTSDPCNVVDPGTIYVGNELWYSLQNTSTSTFVITHGMSDFLTFFTNNHNNNCPNNPGNIDPIFRNQQKFMLPPGDYELKVYRRQKFNLEVNAVKYGMPSRQIPINGNGIAAKTGGGLRIKKIISKDNLTSIQQVKEYDYTVMQNGQKSSTGRLLLYPGYHVPFYCQNTLEFPLVAYMGRSWSNSPLGASGSGNIVGYDQVTEYSTGNGKTEYHYVNQEEEQLAGQKLIEGFPTVKRTNNGLATDVKHYNETGSLVKTENYDYAHQLVKDIKGIATKQLTPQDERNNSPIVTCYDRNIVHQSYTVISDRWVTAQKTERLYAQGSTDYVQTVIDYDHDSQTHLQLKSEQTTSSNGDLIKTVYSYPPDASWVPTAMWQDKYIYGKVVKKETFRNLDLINAYKAYYSAQANTFLLDKEETSIGVGPLEEINVYTYSSKGNILEVTSRDGVKQVYLWGYNNSYPIAQIKHATLPQVLAALGSIGETTLNAFAAETSPSGDYLSRISNLRANLPDAKVNTFTYKPLIGTASQADENCRNIYYEYDSFGRLKLIRDQDSNILKQFDYQYQSPLTQ
ncbi:hypothetical protein AAHN97_21710 [Chitinophaga niabensis]|uniref:hypothetical protein n=1 Tax=Chitinophaga niabensis TaxID=536979 RepID=UPI0031BB9574